MVTALFQVSHSVQLSHGEAATIVCSCMEFYSHMKVLLKHISAITSSPCFFYVKTICAESNGLAIQNLAYNDIQGWIPMLIQTVQKTCCKLYLSAPDQNIYLPLQAVMLSSIWGRNSRGWRRIAVFILLP